MAEGSSLPLPRRSSGNQARGPSVPSLCSGRDPAMDRCALLTFRPQSRPLDAKQHENMLEDLCCSQQSRR